MDYSALADLLFPNVADTPDDLEERFPPRDLPEGAVVSRMAPSPTGFVHLGNLVQGTISERMCTQSGGVHFLRIEDTDAKREVPGAVDMLLRGLGEYGIGFDEGVTADGEKGAYGPYRQRQRASIYHVYAKKLVLEGNAYPCFCTEDELAKIHAEQEAEKANFGYFGKWAIWRDRPIEDIKAAIDAGTPWVLRFRSEGNIENKIPVTDLVKGKLEVTENDIDHVLLKSDGIPTYHFAHAVDDHLMRTTHVVRGDEWLPSLPFHLQLFRALGFRPPKYLHIGTLMKMDGTSKRKLSKRKDPELSLSYYREAGFPRASVKEYLMGILNSNFEDWRRAEPTADLDNFKFSYKKLNPAGSLFDIAKLNDVSKNVISMMTAETVLDGYLDWAREFEPEFASTLENDRETALAVFSIGRGGKKPRKDFGTWAEVKDLFGFFWDEYFKVTDEYPDTFDRADIKAAITKFLETYDPADDQNVWFDKIKAVADSLGYASDMKEYRAEPERFRGSVADVSMFLRVAVTGRMNSPDMYQVMAILGEDRVKARLHSMADSL
ncbi:MAG: glutamate--tRNA ligase [Clostridia bacterium]|nr:glutamate--tRNA ligase [Clostridia bacterium]